jgi:hypothetical protein
MPVENRGASTNFDAVSQSSAPAYAHRNEKKLPRKTACAAFVLTFLGLILLSIGLPIWLLENTEKERERGLAMIILGGISTWHSSYFFCPC